MTISYLRAAAFTAALFAAAPVDAQAGRDSRAVVIARKIANPTGGVIVVAHRGCHNPAPRHGRGSTPENSLTALDQCIAIGVDVMETDVRRSRDGYLVMIHDDTVDRTTDGHGRVADLTLAQLRALRLRENEGGAATASTDQRIVTLDEMLTHGRGKIIFNLDVKDAIYGEVAAAVKQSGDVGQVIVKNYAGIASPLLGDVAPYNATPFIAMLSSGAADGLDLSIVLAQQSAAVHRPVAYEVPRMPSSALPMLAQAARTAGARLWANSLWEGFVTGFGGDLDALRDPDAVWGRLYRGGVSMIQTDEPEALVAYEKRRDPNRPVCEQRPLRLQAPTATRKPHLEHRRECL